MRLLVYEWTNESGNILQEDIRNVLNDMGISYDAFRCDFSKEKIEIDFVQYDACFSINYFPKLSELCKDNNLKYLSWGYDCPFNVRDIENTLGNSCNYVFCFDRNQAMGYQEAGFTQVYHLPLGVNAKRYRRMCDRSNNEYINDIAFVGSLYDNLYQDIMNISEEYVRGYLEGVIESQLLIYGGYFLDKVIGKSLVDRMNSHFKELNRNTDFQLDEKSLIHLIDQETSRRERLYLLGLLGKYFQTTVYTSQKNIALKNVKICDAINYYTQMPEVFRKTKINLNITVKGIQSGVNQRALDVMASNGFLLSNYQQELAEYFVDGEEVAMYESLEDAYAKTNFYLSHDEVRERIKNRGFEKVLRDFNMRDRIKSMIVTAGL